MKTSKYASHIAMMAFNIACGGLNIFLQAQVDSGTLFSIIPTQIFHIIIAKEITRNAQTTLPRHLRSINVIYHHQSHHVIKCQLTSYIIINHRRDFIFLLVENVYRSTMLVDMDVVFGRNRGREENIITV